MRSKCCLIRLPFSLLQANRKTWQPLPGRFQKRGVRSKIAHWCTQAPHAIVLPFFTQPLSWGGRFSPSTDTISNNLDESLSEELFGLEWYVGKLMSNVLSWANPSGKNAECGQHHSLGPALCKFGQVSWVVSMHPFILSWLSTMDRTSLSFYLNYFLYVWDYNMLK